MSATQPSQSPLGRLVLFVVCLAIAGSIVAGAHYYAIDLPGQAEITATAPFNGPGDNCQDCYDWCSQVHPNSGGCKWNCQTYICNK